MAPKYIKMFIGLAWGTWASEQMNLWTVVCLESYYLGSKETGWGRNERGAIER